MTPRKTEPIQRPFNTCPECDSSRVVPIAYGFPSEEMLELERQGKVITGGCTIYDGLSPKWHCNDCGHEWGMFGREDELE